MIQVTLADGRRFWLDKAEDVRLTWFDGEVSRVYRLGEVQKLTLIDPMLRVADGTIRGMPIRGLLFEDASDLVVEVPLPLADARELGLKLRFGTKIVPAREA